MCLLWFFAVRFPSVDCSALYLLYGTYSFAKISFPSDKDKGSSLSANPLMNVCLAVSFFDGYLLDLTMNFIKGSSAGHNILLRKSPYPSGKFQGDIKLILAMGRVVMSFANIAYPLHFTRRT